MQPFRTALMDDLDSNFFNTEEFGESVTLTRGGSSHAMQAIYDAPSLDGLDIGSSVDAIAHRPRLFVRASALPDGAPRKGDLFALESTEFHTASNFKAVDFVFEKDGVVVYKLQEVKG